MLNHKGIQRLAIGIASTMGQADLREFISHKDLFVLHIYDKYFESGDNNWKMAQIVTDIIIQNNGFGYTEKDSIDFIFD